MYGFIMEGFSFLVLMGIVAVALAIAIANFIEAVFPPPVLRFEGHLIDDRSPGC